MTPHLPNPFKPPKIHIFSMMVLKATALFNHPLSIKQVKQLHGLLLVYGLNHLEPMIITQIVSSTSNHSRTTISYLQALLYQSKHPNIFARTSAIRFFYQHGGFHEALAEYVHMQRLGFLPMTSALVFALKACTRLEDRNGGITIHGHVHGYGFCGDVHVATALVGFYLKLDDMEIAKKVFDEMSKRNTTSCVIDRYLESGNFLMAERMLSEMGNMDIASWNSMVSLYTRKGDMEKAIALFGLMPLKGRDSWNAMISGYIDSGELEIARNFYDVMPEQNATSCIKMIDGYSNNGDVKSAREVFDEMHEKNNLLYNAMIICYAQNGWPKDAFHLFYEMLQPNIDIQPDNRTLSTVISICSWVGEWTLGSWIDKTLIKQMKIKLDDHLRIVLIDFYTKYGRVDKAYGFFHGLQKKDVGVYTTMILACSRNGWKYEAIKLFEEMLEANICPNLLTLSGLLTALNHMGMVEEGYAHFRSDNPFPIPRPLNHFGWVQQNYQGVNFTNPLAPPGLLSHEARIEERYHDHDGRIGRS